VSHFETAIEHNLIHRDLRVHAEGVRAIHLGRRKLDAMIWAGAVPFSTDRPGVGRH
jgi:hypothetical protein